MSIKRTIASGNGKLVPLRNLYHAFASIRQAAERKVLKRHPSLPWVPFEAISALGKVLNDQFLVWEIGSGYSTVWLSERVKSVISIEADPNWFERLSLEIRNRDILNVDLRYEWQGHIMASFERFDIDPLYIDGGPRGDCLTSGIKHVKPGGYIYCDNTDVPTFLGHGGFSERIRALSDKIEYIKYFTDYVPGSLVVNEGALPKIAEF